MRQANLCEQNVRMACCESVNGWDRGVAKGHDSAGGRGGLKAPWERGDVYVLTLTVPHVSVVVLTLCHMCLCL